jgi:hypothetical protein
VRWGILPAGQHVAEAVNIGEDVSDLTTPEPTPIPLRYRRCKTTLFREYAIKKIATGRQ